MSEKEIISEYKKVDKLLAQQKPHEAIELVERVIEKLTDKQQWFLARGYFWLQLSYKQLLDIKTAENYGNKSFKIYKKLGDNIQAANVLRDRASLYDHIGKYDKALEILDLSLKEIQDQKVLQTLGLSLAKKGRILSEIGDYAGSEDNLLAAELVIDCTDNIMHQLTVSTHLMELYVKVKKINKASFYARKSENLLTKLKNKEGYLNEVRYSQLQLSKSIIAQSKGLYKEAVMRFGKFIKYGLRPKK